MRRLLPKEMVLTDPLGIFASIAPPQAQRFAACGSAPAQPKRSEAPPKRPIRPLSRHWLSTTFSMPIAVRLSS
jgi:hypothetical protein